MRRSLAYLGGSGSARLAPAAGRPGAEAEVAAAPAWPGLAKGRWWWWRAGAMAEAGPQAPPPPGTPSRHEKSLGLLTTKFVSLLQEAKDGVLDLKLVRPRAKGWKGGRAGWWTRPGPRGNQFPGCRSCSLAGMGDRHPCASVQDGSRAPFHSFGGDHWSARLWAAIAGPAPRGPLFWLGIRGSGYSKVHQAIVAPLVVALEPRHHPPPFSRLNLWVHRDVGEL